MVHVETSLQTHRHLTHVGMAKHPPELRPAIETHH